MIAGEWMVGGGQLLPVPCFSVQYRCSPLAAAAGLAFAPRAAVGCGRASRRCLGERRHDVRSELPADGVERCPAWCAVNHDVASDEFDDVVHESTHLPVAGVVAQRGYGSDGGSERRAVPTELYLVRYQYAGEADEWLYLGDGHHGLDVSPETAQRLRWAIGRLMDTKAARR